MQYPPQVRPHLVANKEHTRYAIAGVAVHLNAQGQAVAVATNGRCLVAMDCEAEAGDGLKETPQVVPSSLWKANSTGAPNVVRKLAIKPQNDGPATVELNGKPGQTFSGRLEESRFPNWKDVVPSGQPVASVRLSGEFLIAMIRAMGCEKGAVDIEIHGDYSPVVLKPAANAAGGAPVATGIGCIMPMIQGGGR